MTSRAWWARPTAARLPLSPTAPPKSAPESSDLVQSRSISPDSQVGTHAYSILDARELGLIPGLGLGNGLLGQTKHTCAGDAPR